ncbi:hypothetical protein [Nocardioides mangrovi]|uniref:Gram-positive cocci surface proteins LPxTG domain-containing protein n=1 Tax=Nocardioides mangrovi TaxID=2874580 RepID=A0ABS7UFW8_9ACTN|nr:hypothetical protein [Nocardioides mangrovi]MBZ5739929.1 hypothetical protein [Nocardioides mangrovi]
MTISRPATGLALAGVATLVTLSCGPLAGTALAVDPPGHAGQQGAAHGQGKDHGKSGENHGKSGESHGKGQDADRAKGQGKGQGQGHGATNPGHGKAPHGGSAGHNPPGNNGTVKIAGPGDAVGTPSNDPHPSCTFDIEWFGYDAGSDVVSTVTFTPQAPTGDVTIGGTAPSQVIVGGDDAGGGTDLDGRQAYDLTFTGAPHPQQGYHVKVTVATPHSLGNDTKTKVFWVAPCDTATGTASDTPAPSASPSPAQAIGTGTDASAGPDRDVAGISASASPDSDTTTGTTAGTSAGSSSAVPTSVDAGEDGALPEWARSPLPLALLGGGVALAGAAVLSRRRSRA